MSKITRYVVYTKIGNQKIRVTQRDSYDEACFVAQVLTDGAISNPRNRTPAHWVETETL